MLRKILSFLADLLSSAPKPKEDGVKFFYPDIKKNPPRHDPSRGIIRMPEDGENEWGVFPYDPPEPKPEKEV